MVDGCSSRIVTWQHHGCRSWKRSQSGRLTCSMCNFAMTNFFHSLSDPETDKRFRLWLSSKPSEVVPLNIVQSSMKVTYHKLFTKQCWYELRHYFSLMQISLDPPQTMKTHLQQMICTETSLLSKDTFESNMYGKTWRSLLFGLCFFHAAVNGRKACGTMGWNAPYSFNSLDFQVQNTLQILWLGKKACFLDNYYYVYGLMVLRTYIVMVRIFFERYCLISSNFIYILLFA